MDFNLKDVCSVVMVSGEVTEKLPDVCKKMERCLSFWKDFMNKQRCLHYYLNYFTAEQIVYLCGQLTQANLTELEDQALMMLSFVRANCAIRDLKQTWHTLRYETLKKPPEQNDDLDYQTFVDVADKTGYEMDTEASFGDGDPDGGTKRFDWIWNEYMRNMKSFLPNTVDVRSLGTLLEILANMPSRDDSEEDDSDDDIALIEYLPGNIDRNLPTGLSAGRPNLIVCPLAEILTCCISIYMTSEREPLPTYDEVLLCSSSTSYEQVELFLRRCLTAGYRGRKIYTMLYVDQLTYEVSYKVEEFFHRHKVQSRNDYRLVLVCSADREHTYLPSVFSPYRLHMVPQEPLRKIQKYLSRHYTVPAEQSSAAVVFKDGKSVGLVTSNRAGVGE